MREELVEKIAKLLEVDTVTADQGLDSFEEWDSLTALSIIAMSGSDYKRTLTNKQLKEFVTIDDLITYILA
jgi:acyl carrier protein